MGKSRTGSTLTHPTSSVSLSIIRQESRLILTNNNNHVILEDKPVHDSETDYSLVIPYRAHSSKSKDDTTIVLEQSSKLTIADGKVFERPVFAVLGVLPLVASNYLVVVTDRVKVGSLFGKHDVFCIKKAEIIPIASDSMIENMNETQAKEDAQYIFMISTFLNSGSFFFSHTYDLSNTMERHQKLSKVQQPETDIHPTWNYVDNRFVWNQHLAGPLLPFSKSFGNWFPPTIQGYVTVHNEMRIADNSFSFALISRRNKNRAGTRYHTRGADKEGNVAAYVETEQILVFPTSSGPQYTSFVQTRGSIPLFWKQDINLAYEPPIVVDHEDDTALRTHFSEQINFYNKQVILNLVKKKGAEKALGYAYKKTVRAWNNEKIRYIGFDVYQHCKGDYAKLSRLINKIQGDMLEMGYFSMDSTNTIKKSQTGVFRTNCKDCLDRTNLVQGLLARLNMIQVLKDFNYIKDENDVEKTSFMTLYRCCWADNGDAISITYAGTPALKGDVTRTGKRSVQGMLDDGFNAITRYYVNNFQDGVKQDAMDLFLGNIAVGNTRNLSSSAVRSEGLIIIAWIVTIFNIIAPLQTRYKYHQMFLVAMVLLVVIFVAKLFRLSKKVVNIPKLPRQIKQKLG